MARIQGFECHHHIHTHPTPTTTITITIIDTHHCYSSSTIHLRLENKVTSSAQGLSPLSLFLSFSCHPPILPLAALLSDEWSGGEVSSLLGLSRNKMTPSPWPPVARSCPSPTGQEQSPLRLHPPHYPLNTLIIPLLIRAAQQIGGCIRGRQCAGAYGIISY